MYSLVNLSRLADNSTSFARSVERAAFAAVNLAKAVARSALALARLPEAFVRAARRFLAAVKAWLACVNATCFLAVSCLAALYAFVKRCKVAELVASLSLAV